MRPSVTAGLDLRRHQCAGLLAAAWSQDRTDRVASVHEEAVASEYVLQLVNSSRCSSNGCGFFAVAQQRGVPLVTEDRAILEAFPEVAQSLHQATP